MQRPYDRETRGRDLGLPAVLAFIALLAVLLIVQSCRAIPAVSATSLPLPTTTPEPAPALPWPGVGAGAVGVLGGGVIGNANDGKPLPLASVTKVMTALVVLEGHPLKPGEPGPNITISHDDVAEYLREAGEDQSVVSVSEGEVITELQLLQGLLIPSGNNLADLLARWDAGNMDAFVARMNAKAAALGMTQTHYADASGISSASAGTASDQVRLGIAAMKDPVFAQIVGSQHADLPVAGTVNSTNKLLGSHEVIGIKTGNTEEAGGCLLFATNPTVGGQRRVVLGAVLGQESLDTAFTASSQLADAMPSVMRTEQVVSANTTVGMLRTAWHEDSEVRPAHDVSLLTWPGAQPRTQIEIRPTRAPVRAGDEVGTLTVDLGDQHVTVPLHAVSSISTPGLFWRLTRR